MDVFPEPLWPASAMLKIFLAGYCFISKFPFQLLVLGLRSTPFPQAALWPDRSKTEGPKSKGRPSTGNPRFSASNGICCAGAAGNPPSALRLAAPRCLRKIRQCLRFQIRPVQSIQYVIRIYPYYSAERRERQAAKKNFSQLPSNSLRQIL